SLAKNHLPWEPTQVGLVSHSVATCQLRCKPPAASALCCRVHDRRHTRITHSAIGGKLRRRAVDGREGSNSSAQSNRKTLGGWIVRVYGTGRAARAAYGG